MPEATSHCRSCRRNPPAFDWARAWGPYNGALRRLIHHFKFRGQTRLKRPLAALLHSSLQSANVVEPRWILAIPSHRSRIRERGLDHSGLLARSLSAQSGIPLFRGLHRVRPTQPQFGLQRKDRQRNVRGAFQIDNPRPLEDEAVVLVDDVLTTGATANEIAGLLKREASPAVIGVVSIARAQLIYG